MSVIVLVAKSYFHTVPRTDLSRRQGNARRITHTIASVKRTRAVIRRDIQNPGVRVNHTLMGHERIVKSRNRVPCEMVLSARFRRRGEVDPPASSDTKILSCPTLATPTNMRGVADPFVPAV